MTETLHIDPREFALTFSYMEVDSIVGWGREPFAPPPANADAFFEQGRDLLTASGRLVPGDDPGSMRFDPSFREIAETLADPQIVLVTVRREDGGARTITHHARDTHVVQTTRRPDGRFAVRVEPSMAAAAGAAAAFVGAAAESIDEEARFEATQSKFAVLKKLCAAGNPKAAAALKILGANESQSRSAMTALGAPNTAGMVSVMYCAENEVRSAETYAVLTNADGQSWVTFSPGDADGPAVLERTSIGALASRILVGISTRMLIPM